MLRRHHHEMRRKRETKPKTGYKSNNATKKVNWKKREGLWQALSYREDGPNARILIKTCKTTLVLKGKEGFTTRDGRPIATTLLCERQCSTERGPELEGIEKDRSGADKEALNAPIGFSYGCPKGMLD